MEVQDKQMFSAQLYREQIMKMNWLEEQTGIRNRSKLFRTLIDKAVLVPIVPLEVEEDDV